MKFEYNLYILLVMIFVGVYDLYYNKIPNIIIITIIICSFAFSVFHNGFYGLTYSILGIFLGLSVLLIPHLFGGMAAGDVKLMGAVGAALGPLGVIVTFLYSAIAGGIYALILMIAGRSGDLPKRLWNTLQTFYYTRQFIYDKPQRSEQQVKLCYGVAIAAGTILYIVLEMTGKGQLIQF